MPPWRSTSSSGNVTWWPPGRLSEGRIAASCGDCRQPATGSNGSSSTSSESGAASSWSTGPTWTSRPCARRCARADKGAVSQRRHHGRAGLSPCRVRFPAVTGRCRLFLIRVVDVERLVGDEQERAVAILAGAVLHDPALREPYEAAGAECAPMRLECAVEDVNAVRAGMCMPGVGKPGPVDQLENLHTSVRVADQRHGWQFDAELGDWKGAPFSGVGVDDG